MNIHESEVDAARLIDEKRYQDARRLLLRLSDDGSLYSWMTLGWIYSSGVLGRRDMKAAKHYLNRAASTGDPEACRRFGRLLDDLGETPNARVVFEMGAKNGNIGSMYRFGIMLFDGIGGPQDKKNGLFWIERSAENGHIYAQRKLVLIKIKNSDSILKKVLMFPRLIFILLKGSMMILSDMHSDKVL